MSGQKLPLCELKDGIDLAISKFVKESKLEDMIPNELRFFLPKIYEAEAEATVEKIVKFRTKPSQVLRITRKAKGISSNSFQDAFEKAKKEANILAQPDIENHAKTLQKSVDVGSINDTICGLDSSTLDEYIKKMDENKYELIKDLNLTELDLEIKKGETLTIPTGIALTNKKNINVLGNIIINGNLTNLNKITLNHSKNNGALTKYKTGNFSGSLPSIIETTDIQWPSGSDLFNITNDDNTNLSTTISNSSTSPNVYIITQSWNQSTSYSSTTNNNITNLSINTTNLPTGITGFYLTDINTIGAGGGGGSAQYLAQEELAICGNGGAGGANIVTSTLNYYNINNPFSITDNISIQLNTGIPGPAGPQLNFYSGGPVPNWSQSYNTNKGGLAGGNSSLSIYNNESLIFQQNADGGLGGGVVDVSETINTSSLVKNIYYQPQTAATSVSYQYSNSSQPLIVNGFSGGIGGMGYNYDYQNSTSGTSPIGGLYGAGGGCGVGQGTYPGGKGGNPYSGAQAGGGGGGYVSNIGGKGYAYYTAGDGVTPVQPAPSFGGGGGGAGFLWGSGGQNSGQQGGSGYNSISITFVQDTS
jgi:hypothetical protein